MNVLVMGYRKGICLALEKLEIKYIIWHPKKIKTKRKASQIITGKFPKSKKDLIEQLPINIRITHVISGTEDSVFPASLVRKWLNTKRNPLSVAVKCTDKLKMKLYLKDKGIPMTPFLGKQMYEDPDQVIEELGETLIVKPRKNSGGRGLKVITDKSEIDVVLNNRTLLEKVIEGSEGSVETIIEDSEIKFINITHYQKIGTCNYIPNHYSKKIQASIAELNKSVIKALKIKWGITHLEFYNTKNGLLFGEIALRPPGGYIMDTLKEVYGCNFWELLVRTELDLKIHDLPKHRKYGASYILYPKEGVVSEVIGEEDVRNLQSVIKFKVKAKVGDMIRKRAGVGEDFGYCIFAHESKQQLLDDLKTFEKKFKINTVPG